MATSSIFADFSIRDKKSVRSFVLALEASSKDRRKNTNTKVRILTPEEIKKRFSVEK